MVLAPGREQGFTYLSNSYSSLVLADCTSGQFPAEQETAVLVPFVFPEQYAAADHWAYKPNWLSTADDTSSEGEVSLCLSQRVRMEGSPPRFSGAATAVAATAATVKSWASSNFMAAKVNKSM